MKDCSLADTFIKDSTTKMLTVNLNVIMPGRICLLLSKMLFFSRVHLTLTHNRALLTQRFSRPPVPTLLLHWEFVRCQHYGVGKTWILQGKYNCPCWACGRSSLVPCGWGAGRSTKFLKFFQEFWFLLSTEQSNKSSSYTYVAKGQLA